MLVGFEERNEYLFFWLGGVLFVIGSIADILDGALARAASKGTVFGAFLDSSFDRVGEAAMLAAIGLAFMRDGNEIALVAAFAAVIGSFLVSYTRAKAESLGLRADVGFGSRVERVVLISIGLGLAPWGLLQWPIYALAAHRVADRRPAHPLRAPPAPRDRRPGVTAGDKAAALARRRSAARPIAFTSTRSSVAHPARSPCAARGIRVGPGLSPFCCPRARICDGKCCQRGLTGTETCCDGRCVDMQFNRQHCGRCGRQCIGTQRCVNGACVD